jgi:CDP-paratose 2-epimerase
MILVTGGAGFVGSKLAISLAEAHPEREVIALDNLHRRGSELNVSRLERAGVRFVPGDVKEPSDLAALGSVEALIECSAEPAATSGLDGDTSFVFHTNLTGAYNCLELARRDAAFVVFLSTSRVYPVAALNALAYAEEETRFVLADQQPVPGASSDGISEDFPLEGARTLYGATKLAAELLIEEYREMFGLRAAVNRCGVIAGPWQMGKVDQGVIAFWLANHVYGQPLAYFGYGGCGLQVRDVLHVQDLYALLRIQLERMAEVNGQIYNIGGGHHVSVSLRELTEHCRRITGVSIEPRSVPEDRTLDIRVYLSDHAKATRELGWRPCFSLVEVLEEMHRWLLDNRRLLEPIFGGGSPGRI